MAGILGKLLEQAEPDESKNGELSDELANDIAEIVAENPTAAATARDILDMVIKDLDGRT